MRHLQHLLFGIILLSSFGSAFADDYDPRQDVFDQVINALVPTLIVFLNFKEADEKKLLSSINEESEDVIKQEDVEIQQNGAEESEDVRKQGDVEIQQNGAKKRGWKKQLKSKFNKIRKKLPPVKIKRAFDDFLFLLSLFVLPSVVFHKNHEKFATPLWISILSGVATAIVFIMIMINYICWHIDNGELEEFNLINFIYITPYIINLCHIFSDICFLFYTRSIPTDNFTDAFIYIHAITGVLGAIFLLCAIITLFIDSLHDYGYRLPSKIKDFLNNVVVDVIGVHFGKFLITITFLWTPIVQMLNMALLSGNDYYWTKLILALNLIYISRVLYYTVEKKFSNLDKAEFFGLLNIIFYLRHKI
ncbi:hypothetical protein RhiirC2_717070 [Rhizophagus irregularis]|uniref:Uncharacterized protein n=2 Tax=Rhizophagus irregularis TaxID=588596 RepID=A0A2N1MNW2_9GLOM|nr:hypothetical protein RhiirC2_717070 [Rhizophagus irregularis]